MCLLPIWICNFQPLLQHRIHWSCWILAGSQHRPHWRLLPYRMLEASYMSYWLSDSSRCYRTGISHPVHNCCSFPQLSSRLHRPTCNCLRTQCTFPSYFFGYRGPHSFRLAAYNHYCTWYRCLDRQPDSLQTCMTHYWIVWIQCHILGSHQCHCTAYSLLSVRNRCHLTAQGCHCMPNTTQLFH